VVVLTATQLQWLVRGPLPAPLMLAQ